MMEPPAIADKVGPLTRKVLDYEQIIRSQVRGGDTPPDWTRLAEYVAVDEFERIGTFLEVQDWQQYTEMLTRWASATARFETTLRRITELASHVYYEIEERHFHGDDVTVVNSMTVFEFDEGGKIGHLDVYLQQARSPR